MKIIRMEDMAEEKKIGEFITSTTRAVKLLVAKEENITIPRIKNSPFENYSKWFRKKPIVGTWPIEKGNNTKHYFYKGNFIHDFQEGFTFSEEGLMSESYGNRDFISAICGDNEISCSATSANTQEYKGPVFVGSSRWGYTNYWHWLLDVVAKILLFIESEAATCDIPCIIHSGIRHDYQKQWLKIIKDYASKKGVKIITTDKRYIQSRELIWSNSLALPHPSKTLKDIFEQVLEDHSFGGDDSYFKGNNILLMRERKGVRSVYNFDEIVHWANNNDFNIVVAEEFSIKEQINIFRNCKTLISIHGAGMSNTVFMKKNGKVIELSPDSGFNPAIQDLCAACDMDYSLIICKGVGNKQEINVNTLSLDDALKL